jgi:aspartate beta-hydroxylase
MLAPALDSNPDHPRLLNALGLIALGEGRFSDASLLYRRAVRADPSAPPLWLNLADAQHRNRDLSGAIISLDAALAIDPYMVDALIRKALILRQVGHLADSAKNFRILLGMFPDAEAIPPHLRAQFDLGREVVDADNRRRGDAMARPSQEVIAAHPGADPRRALAYLDNVAGLRKTFVQEPTGPFFPFLPAIEFFDRDHFPWFTELEHGVEVILAEYLALTGADGFAPYVNYAPGEPVNQWSELNGQTDWSAFFLWKDGVRQDENCARCPETAALVGGLPLMDVANRAPTVMFSVLKPHTRIPPHVGVTNVRVTVHLPLLVPPDCAIRVGSETRDVRRGEVFAFDDTIEHEAWNRSDMPRAVLIIDAWNPYLTPLERDMVRAVGRIT